MPAWLDFSQAQRRFFGVPTEQDMLDGYCEGSYSYVPFQPPNTRDIQHNQVTVMRMICENIVEVVVSDEYDKTNGTITFNIYNNQPYPFRPIYRDKNGATELEIHINTQLSFTFAEDCFLDPDYGDQLTYMSFLFNGTTNTQEDLPSWVQFQPKIKQFSLQPTSQHLRNCDPVNFVSTPVTVQNSAKQAITVEKQQCVF